MSRLNGKRPFGKFPGKQKIWLTGEIAEKGSYVCVHCNSHTAMEQSGYLPLCPSCYSRRFKQL